MISLQIQKPRMTNATLNPRKWRSFKLQFKKSQRGSDAAASSSSAAAAEAGRGPFFVVSNYYKHGEICVNEYSNEVLLREAMFEEMQEYVKRSDDEWKLIAEKYETSSLDELIDEIVGLEVSM